MQQKDKKIKWGKTFLSDSMPSLQSVCVLLKTAFQCVIFIYTYCSSENAIFCLTLLAEHFRRKMNWKKTQHLLCCSIFLLTSNKVSVILQCLCVRAKGMKLLWWGAEKHSVNYKVWKLTEFSLWLLTELIGVEPRFSGCFHRHWDLN